MPSSPPLAACAAILLFATSGACKRPVPDAGMADNRNTIREKSTVMDKPISAQLAREIVSVDSLSCAADGAVWLAAGGRLQRWAPPGPIVPVDAQLDGNHVEIEQVAPGPEGQLLVIARPNRGRSVAAWFRPGETGLQPIALTGEPRRAAWAGPLSAVFYVATDTTLNLASGSADRGLDAEHRYNALVVSPAGRLVAARRIGTDDVMVTRAGEIAWSEAKKKFGGELLGVGDDGTLLLLDMGLWEKRDRRPDNRLHLARPDGVDTTLAVGPIVNACLAGRRLVIVRDPGRQPLAVEMQTLP